EIAAPSAMCGRFRLYRCGAVGGMAAGRDWARCQGLSLDRHGRGSLWIVAPRGSRPMPAGDNGAGCTGCGRYPLGVHETRGLRGWRRLVGGDLCTSIAVDQSLTWLREIYGNDVGDDMRFADFIKRKH